MADIYRLRPATPDDAELLLSWRNDPATRTASRNMAEIQSEEHASWLAASLENPNRKLWIAEREHIPVGTVRADLSNGIWNLSWTVAPESRGCGAGKAIVAAAARSISGPVRAEIKTYNVASARIAVHAGMQLVRQENDTLYFERPCPDST